MVEYLITKEQIKAARALRQWDQKDLADQIGISMTALGNIETGKSRPSSQTLSKIIHVFSQEGIEFIIGGVRHRQDIVSFIGGEECFEKLMIDAYEDQKKIKGEVLFKGADERKNSEIIDHMTLKMRDAGIRTRFLIEEGNSYILGNKEDYRCIPKKYYTSNDVTVIYGNKVAYYLGDGNIKPVLSDASVMIIHHPVLAENARRDFEFLWAHCKSPDF